MIQETENYNMIKDMLLNDEELFERISDDFTNPDLFDPAKQKWLGWFEDNECLGLLSVHPENAIVLNMHIHIPGKYRGERSFEIGNGLIQFLIDNCNKQFIKINIKIPEIYPDVIRFAEKCEIEKEGVDKHSFLKNGEIYNRIIMGKIIR